MLDSMKTPQKSTSKKVSTFAISLFLTAGVISAVITGGPVFATVFDQPAVSSDADTAAGSSEATGSFTTKQRDQLTAAFVQLQTQFAGHSLYNVSVYFPLSTDSYSPVRVTEFDGSQFAWSTEKGAFVSESPDELVASDYSAQAFTIGELSLDVVLQRIDRAQAFFDDPTLVVGSVFVTGAVGDAVASVDVRFTSEEPELKPSVTFDHSGAVIGVLCPAGKGCDALDAIFPR
jgi:hypothetical protein